MKLLTELPQIGAKSHSDVFNSIFGERAPDFEQAAHQQLRDWTYEQYVEEMTREGRAVRYSEEKFNELKEMRFKEIGFE